jgi:alpha-1,6-mannosyltransferase
MARPAGKLAFLVLVGCLLLALNAVCLHLQHRDNLPWFVGTVLAQGAIYLVGVRMVLIEKIPTALTVVLLFAALLRMSVLFSTPYLSDDIYRYVWDGRVQAAGINPYRFVPDSPELKRLQDDRIYPRINRGDYAPTIYPPVAQFIFLAASRVSESITWMKTVMVVFETLAVWALIRLLGSLGLPAERVLIYAWNPLSIWEFAGNGHIDAAAIAFMVLALWMRKRNLPALTGIALACATLVKFYPAVIFPALYRRWDWKMPAAFAATVVMAYAPYAKAGLQVLGFLPGYIKEEGLKSGERFYLWMLLQKARPASWFSGVWYMALLLLVLALIAVWLMFRKQDAEGDFLVHAAILASLCAVLFSPHYAWYFAWVIPLLVFVPYVPMLYLSVAAFILYESRLQENSETLLRDNTLLYVPFAGLMAMHWLWSRRRPASAAAVGIPHNAEGPNAR